MYFSSDSEVCSIELEISSVLQMFFFAIKLLGNAGLYLGHSGDFIKPPKLKKKI